MRRAHLEPTDHGVPQRRKRCWFLCAAIKDGDVSAAERQGALFMDLALGIIDDTKLPCLPLDAVLMAEDSADLPLWQRERLGRRSTNDDSGAENVGSEAVDGSKVAWPDLHMAMYRSKNLRWPHLLELIYSKEKLSKLRMLPRRMREIIAFIDQTSAPIREDSPDEIIDIGQMLNRVSRATEKTLCVMPWGVLWSRKRFRMLEANETLALQSWPLMTRAQLSGFSSVEISDLAGNAFNGANVAACLLALLTTYTWPEAA